MNELLINPEISTTRSYGVPPAKRTVYFVDMPTEQLKELIKPAWPEATRAQALAWVTNRYRCGFMYVYEELGIF